ncbi:unnamed protein product [Sphenostylis stenocarpa]|uniref:Uncharacterized protein n=1 Tax=Sphenostylis stenocarpa TaxID=92480 RepID=A0AA86V3J6_9FABA|nr:unnamed protein product [Sphenostylis stenocarpa]
MLYLHDRNVLPPVCDGDVLPMPLSIFNDDVLKVTRIGKVGEDRTISRGWKSDLVS